MYNMPSYIYVNLLVLISYLIFQCTVMDRLNKKSFFSEGTHISIKLHCSVDQPTQVRALRKGQTNLKSLGTVFLLLCQYW